MPFQTLSAAESGITRLGKISSKANHRWANKEDDEEKQDSLKRKKTKDTFC